MVRYEELFLLFLLSQALCGILSNPVVTVWIINRKNVINILESVILIEITIIMWYARSNEG